MAIIKGFTSERKAYRAARCSLRKVPLRREDVPARRERKHHRALAPSAFVFLIVLISNVAVRAQESSISGIVTDSSTGLPLEDAIAYLENSAVGTSTRHDGGFTLAGLLPGRYKLIIARVGYMRHASEVTVGQRDSLTFAFALVPGPIRLHETEVIGTPSIEFSRRGMFLFPVQRGDSYCLYGAETAVPIGFLPTDSVLCMCSAEPAVVDSQWYLRVWLLLYNISEKSLNFDTRSAVSLDVRKVKSTYRSLRPWFPESNVADARDSLTSQIVSGTIGRTLQVLGDQRVAYIKGAELFERRARASWMGRNAPAEVLGGANPQYLRGVYDQCQFMGTLRHYNISPGSGVHGYIYFPWPGLNWQISGTGLTEAYTSQYTLNLLTPSGVRRIEFTPH